MPLRIIRSDSNTILFNACADAFLNSEKARLWLTHRIQRDALFERALAQGKRGWFSPPIDFLSALPTLFEIKGVAIGTLARRELISAIGYEQGDRYGIRIGNQDATITRGQMLDGFIGELLPEGISPSQLRDALERGDPDEFGRRRNAWLADVYENYLRRLNDIAHYDPRSVHALVAERIDAGMLPTALNGATALHIYGLYSGRARDRLLRALARQSEVDVVVYTTSAANDFSEYATSVDDLPAAAPSTFVQPAPDANRENQWVALQVKRLIVEQGIRPHDIAVVARTGAQDTRRAMQALERIGVPATARVRTRLSEVSALKAVLELFRGSAQDWSYRVLRNLLASPYFRFHIDLRPFDAIACQARPCSLEQWEHELIALIDRLENKEDPEGRRIGLRVERVRKDLERFQALRRELEPLDGDKPLGEWMQIARRFLSERRYRFRHRVCDSPDARQDVVRIDQRGVHRFEALLSEWASSDDTAELLSPRDWFRSVRALLEWQELVLTTPGQKGVQVLEAHDAALAPFSAVFLLHANDGEFPKSAPTGGLFSQEERAQLRTLGLPIDDRRSTLARERVLWSAVCGNAVTITYRTTDPNGTPLLPSLLVPPHDPATELPRTFVQGEGDVEGELFGTADVAGMRRSIVRAYAETRRGAPERTVSPISPWNGQLRDPWLLNWLSDRYNSSYVWSVSQLQTYTACPFFFLVERVLGLKAIEEADEDTNALASGGVAHEVLERYYKELIGQSAPTFDHAHFIDLAGSVFRKWENEGHWLGLPALWEQRRLWLLQTLCRFVEWDLEKHLVKGQSVWACEYAIGDDDGVELSGKDVHHAMQRMKLRGRIDRIDSKRGELEVVDYKSGKMPSGKDGYADGAVLQGPVYMHALQQQGHNAVKSLYRSIKEQKNGAALKIDDPQFARALAIAFSVPERVRGGTFECALAESAKDWSSWHPDGSIRRTSAVVEGSRFDAR